MEIVLSVLMGISLSAACGFRIFAPLLIVSMAAKCEWLSLGQGFDWLGSDAALIAFAAATVLEIVAYYIPVLDNFLDAAGIPVAAVAGTCLTASMVTDISPFLQWTLAAIAGGGTASVIHAGTSAVRAAVTPTTAGLGNSIMSTAETTASGSLSLLAIILPIVGGLAAIVLVVLTFFGIRKLLKRKEALARCPSA